MRRISPLEQRYKDLKRQAAPDLWSRIEGHLEERPDRSVSRGGWYLEQVTGLDLERQEQGLRMEERHREWEEKENRKAAGRYKGLGILPGRIVLGTAAAAAAVFLLMAMGPWYDDLLSLGRKEEILAEGPETFGRENGWAEETTAFVQDTDLAGEDPSVFAEEDPLDIAEEDPPADEGKKAEGTQGVLLYSQLELADRQSLSLPAQAVTVSEDAMYFSEKILGDTELLCLGTVISVSLGTDDSGCPARLVYEIRVDSVCYSDDRTTGLTHIQVESPIVGAVEGHDQILYQLQEEASYVLSLKSAEGGWELVFPYAPQIRVVPGGGYLFHSGYGSLADDSTFVVVGQQEGANDFYYDRMLLRDDDHFLSDLISLVIDQSLDGGRS